VTKKLLALVLGVAALAALAATLGYAVANATNAPYRPMMGGAGFSMMGMGGARSPWYLRGTGPVTTIAQARAHAQRLADRLELTTSEVIQFTNNFYVRLDDSAGKPATEVLVDPKTGDVTLEYGPAMMWNTRFGMMSGSATTNGRGGMMGNGAGGMMGGHAGATISGGPRGMMGGGMMSGMMGSHGAAPSWTPEIGGSVSAEQARSVANSGLARQGAGLTAAQPDAFPGYFTMETVKDGTIVGMLSVNAGTGAVFYHWWHGTFVAMTE